MLELRKYQKEACRKIWQALSLGKNALLQAPTGCGKSCVVAATTKQAINIIPACRVLVLVDREVLVSQLADSFGVFYPELRVGVVCASVSSKKIHHNHVTIASRQTLVGVLDDMEPINLLILDEAHLAKPQRKGQKMDQYAEIIEELLLKNKKMRIFGCSATPYRLASGHIYGNAHHPLDHPYFKELTHKITYAELTSKGFLAELVGDIPENKIDLSQVSLVAGDYNIGQLSTVMGLNVGSVLEAIETLAEGRKKIMVFAVDISHCEMLHDILYSSVVYHSKLSKIEKQAAMSSFKAGSSRVIISVATLTTGFDQKAVDCIVMARPTLSPALFMQMVGRGLRTADGKENCLLIDLTNNTAEHTPTNDLDKIFVKIPSGVAGEGDAPFKLCPGILPNDMQCLSEVHPKVLICHDCGYKWEKLIADNLKKMESVNFQHDPPQWIAVTGMQVSDHTSKKNGKHLIKVSFDLDVLTEKGTAYAWICLPDHYEGYAVERGEEIWEKLSPDQFPEDIESAMWLADDMVKPERVLCSITAQGFYNIEDYDMGEVEEDLFGLDLVESTGEDVPF